LRGSQGKHKHTVQAMCTVSSATSGGTYSDSRSSCSQIHNSLSVPLQTDRGKPSVNNSD